MGSSKDNPSSEEPGSAQLGLGALIGMPWLMFSMVSGLFALAYHHYPLVVWSIIVCFVILAFFFLTLDARNRMGGSWFMLLAILCICAIANGCIVGMYNYWVNMYPYWSYYEHDTYTNVLPSESAVTHSDAGTIIFANTARVDTTRALGFKQDMVYCVAPILGDHHQDRVEYWAAGINCCNSRGDFACDDSWDPKAKSGLVLPSFIGGTVEMSKVGIGISRPWWKGTPDNFIEAVKMAEASYEMKSAEHPLLVRWTSHPQTFVDDLWRQGVGWVVGSVSVYLLISLIMGAGLQACSKRTASAQQRQPSFGDA